MKTNKKLFIFMALATVFAYSAAFTGCKNKEVESISLNPENLIFEELGQTIQMTATIYPDNADNKKVTWFATSNASLDAMSVDQNTGLVTALDTTKLGTIYNISCIADDGFVQKNAPVIVGNLAKHVSILYKGNTRLNNGAAQIDTLHIIHPDNYPSKKAAIRPSSILRSYNCTDTIGIDISALLKDKKYLFEINGTDSITINGTRLKVTVTGTVDIESNISLNYTFSPSSQFSEMSFQGKY